MIDLVRNSCFPWKHLGKTRANWQKWMSYSDSVMKNSTNLAWKSQISFKMCNFVALCCIIFALLKLSSADCIYIYIYLIIITNNNSQQLNEFFDYPEYKFMATSKLYSINFRVILYYCFLLLYSVQFIRILLYKQL